jgi:hypothetical protein
MTATTASISSGVAFWSITTNMILPPCLYGYILLPPFWRRHQWYLSLAPVPELLLELKTKGPQVSPPALLNKKDRGL